MQKLEITITEANLFIFLEQVAKAAVEGYSVDEPNTYTLGYLFSTKMVKEKTAEDINKEHVEKIVEAKKKAKIA